jgi:hypothetical protein
MSEPIDTVNQLVRLRGEPLNSGTLSRDSPRWSLPWSRRSSM